MYWDADVFILGKITVQIKVLQVSGHESIIWSADDAVEEALGGLNVSFLSCDIAGVATGHLAYVFGIDLFGTVSADDSDISEFLVLGNVFLVDKE
jgi:hypothetical protein